MKIKNLLPVYPTEGQVGVEIEVEGENLPGAGQVKQFWKVESDSSLRGESAEYVLRSPVRIREVKPALDNLSKAFKANNAKFFDSFRAGIHVHVNVQDLTPVELMNFIVSYYVLEEALLAYCSDTRAGNHFCLRMKDASYPLDLITKCVVDNDVSVLNTEDIRYASLNITSLFKYGSVEFRALESTSNFDKVETWCKMLHHLKSYAKTIPAPTYIIEKASFSGFKMFAKEILGPYYPVLQNFASDETIRRGVRNVQYFVYSRDWTKKEMNIFKKNIFF